MKTTILSVKVDEKDKRDAQILARKLGFNLSTLVKAYLKEFLRTKEVNVRLEDEMELSAWAKKQLAQGKKEVEQGYVSPAFKTVAEEIAWLKDPNAKYANGRPVRE